MNLDARVVCLPASRAKVFKVKAGVVVYFDHRFVRTSTEDGLADVVAHEVARLILGHQDIYYGSNEEAVDAVGKVVKKWGFKRTYSRAAYRALDLNQPMPKTKSPGL